MVVEEEEARTWARHLMSSVGVEITHVARPPSAPAMNVVRSVGCWMVDVLVVVLFEEVGGVREPYVRYDVVRLYVMNSNAFRAP